ncbi:MAG: nitroreductase family protein [Calditrichaeota bacterium]|nr:nitroreductase family protein [Calditrichota bacterium]
MFQRPVTELIRTRRSCRTFARRGIEHETREALLRYLEQPIPGPFGSSVRLGLLELGEGQRIGARLGTYGVIRGARGFLLGAVRRSAMDLEDFGFVFEAAVLKATELGLGTCWLGGTFKRSSFAAALRLAEDELLPAVSPVGHPDERRSMLDVAFRAVAKSATRKPWQELFFAGTLAQPLTPEEAGPFATPLEMVRLAPWASNRQPWRVVWDGEQGAFHFFLQRTRGYRVPGAVDLQRVDMGIALCHFALAAQEMGLRGRWQRLSTAPLPGTLHYIASWCPADAIPCASGVTR